MHFGWLQDSIWHLVDSDWCILQEFPYVLVTCIDSTKDVKSTVTARKIAESEVSCSFLGTSLVVGNARIIDVAARCNLFSHFDEIWLFQERPVVGKPPGTSIVAPVDLNTETPPKDLLDWFIASNCVLGLGDGIGMNYITGSRNILDALNARQRQFTE
jgi:hypothetical protein